MQKEQLDTLKLYLKAYRLAEEQEVLLTKMDYKSAAEDDVLEELDMDYDEDENYPQEVKDEIQSRYEMLLDNDNITEEELDNIYKLEMGDEPDEIASSLCDYIESLE